jgi:hypothetical protein
MLAFIIDMVDEKNQKNEKLLPEKTGRLNWTEHLATHWNEENVSSYEVMGN